jgi:hypothetical protein
MSKLRERLLDPSRCGVYRSSASDVIEEAVRGTELSLARVALEGVKTSEALLDAIARELAFPKWFGRNWDALEDCLTDLSWQKTQGAVVIFSGFVSIPGDDLGILVDVLGSSASFWTARGRPFFAVFVDPARTLALADLYREK